MNILIAKANEQLIQSICPAKKINFHQMNRAGRFGNTSYFKLTKPQFDKLYKEIIAAGYNPFALLTW